MNQNGASEPDEHLQSPTGARVQKSTLQAQNPVHQAPPYHGVASSSHPTRPEVTATHVEHLSDQHPPPLRVPEPLPYPITGWKRTKNHSHLDVTDLTGRAPEKGSIADLPQPELHKLLGLLLQDLDERMVKPVRSRMMYREYWCPHPKRQQRAAGDDQNIMTFLPCGNTATCQKCCDWENFLHIERCWRGEPAQMVVVSGFGGADSTIAETVGMAKVYRGRWQDRLRKTSAVDKYQENPTSSWR